MLHDTKSAEKCLESYKKNSSIAINAKKAFEKTNKQKFYVFKLQSEE